MKKTVTTPPVDIALRTMDDDEVRRVYAWFDHLRNWDDDRSAGLDETQRRRLKWRTERVLVESHHINCLTFDELYTQLRDRFILYREASKLEIRKKK